MTIDEVQHIVDYAYPNIKKYYGKAKKSYPVVELHKDIYARLSGDPENKIGNIKSPPHRFIQTPSTNSSSYLIRNRR